MAHLSAFVLLDKSRPIAGIEGCLHYLSGAALSPSSMASAIIEIGKGEFYGGVCDQNNYRRDGLASLSRPPCTTQRPNAFVLMACFDWSLIKRRPGAGF